MLVPPGERSWAHLGTATGALASGPVFVWRRIVPQSCTLSVSPEIVAAREDFFNHGWTRINTDEDRLSLIRVHPCSSVVGTYWLRLRRAAVVSTRFRGDARRRWYLASILCFLFALMSKPTAV